MKDTPEEWTRPSTVINEFLRFLDYAKEEHESGFQDVGAEDAKLQTFLHDIELAGTPEALEETAAKLQESRRARREAKDRAQLYELVRNVYADMQKSGSLKALRRLSNEQAAREKYLFGKREFRKRVE